MTPENTNLQHFTDSFNLENLINEATCFKGLPSCIDLIITNRKPYYENNCVTTTGMSDFHERKIHFSHVHMKFPDSILTTYLAFTIRSK